MAWSDWEDHDGTNPGIPNGTEVEIVLGCGCIVHGRMGEPQRRHFIEANHYAGPRFSNSWIWLELGRSIPVVRYRFRVSGAFVELERIAAEPKPLDEPLVRVEEMVE